MLKKDLEFLLAFADIEGLNDKPVTEVIELAVDFLNSDGFMDDYLAKYKLMKQYHLDAEVKTLECRILGKCAITNSSMQSERTNSHFAFELNIN